MSGKKQVEPGPTLEQDDELIFTTLQEVIGDEVKLQVANVSTRSQQSQT